MTKKLRSCIPNGCASTFDEADRIIDHYRHDGEISLRAKKIPIRSDSLVEYLRSTDDTLLIRINYHNINTRNLQRSLEKVGYHVSVAGSPVDYNDKIYMYISKEIK